MRINRNTVTIGLLVLVASLSQGVFAQNLEDYLVDYYQGDGKQFVGKDVANTLIQLTKKGRFFVPLWPKAELIEKTKIPKEKVPAQEYSDSVGWMKKILKEDWRPKDLEERVLVLKDLVTYKMPISKEVVLVGDFIITQYEVNGVKFEIHEDGWSVGVLIVPPKATDISKGAEDFIRESLRAYFYYPEKKLTSLVFNFRKDSVVSDDIYADANCDPRGVPEAQLLEWGKENDKWWWQNVTVCTDGKFIFFHFREYDGVTRRIMHGKLPDRW